jgi:hypothetical protein
MTIAMAMSSADTAAVVQAAGYVLDAETETWLPTSSPEGERLLRRTLDARVAEAMTLEQLSAWIEAGLKARGTA